MPWKVRDMGDVEDMGEVGEVMDMAGKIGRENRFRHQNYEKSFTFYVCSARHFCYPFRETETIRIAIIIKLFLRIAEIN